MRIMRNRAFLACALVLCASACSRHSSEPADASSQQASDMAPVAAPQMPEAKLSRPSEVAAGEASESDVASQLQSAATSQEDSERKFIRTATVEFRARDVYRTALAIEDLVAQHGGFVVRNNIRTEIENVQTRPSGDGNLVELATYTVRGALQLRVPSAHTQAFLRALAGQIEFLDSRNYEAADAQFELLRQQLAYARNQDAQRALGDVAQGRGKLGEKSDAIAARTGSQALRDEALIAQKTFEDRVAFATIDLTLYQPALVRRTERLDVEAVVRRERPGFFPRLGHALSLGWFGLLDTAIGLSGLWPLWLLLAAAVVVIRRRRRN